MLTRHISDKKLSLDSRQRRVVEPTGSAPSAGSRRAGEPVARAELVVALGVGPALTCRRVDVDRVIIYITGALYIRLPDLRILSARGTPSDGDAEFEKLHALARHRATMSQ